MVDSFLKKVRAALEQHEMIRPGERVVAAVSGGGDSCAMLLALHALRDEYQLGEIFVAHLNHGLREPDSSADAAFVRDLALSLDLPVCVEARDVRGYAAAQKLSLEAAAHEVRYRFLAEVAQSHHATAVALGHTQEDRTETFFLHLFRGAGLTGLSSMRPVISLQVQGVNDVRFVRPIIHCKHEEAEAYLATRGITPRVDSTNADQRFQRNRLRHRLLPLLRKEFCDDLDRRIDQLMLLCEGDDDFLQAQAIAAWERLKRTANDGECIERSGLSSLHRSLQRRVVRLVHRSICGPRCGLDFQDVENLLNWLRDSATGGRWSLPGNVEVECRGNELIFRRKRDISAPRIGLPERPIAVPGMSVLEDFGLTVETRLFDLPAEVKFPCDKNTVWIDAGKVGSLTVRYPREGDRFYPLGAGEGKNCRIFL